MKTENACVREICIAPNAGTQMVNVESVRAITNAGLDGDRYCVGTGFYSDKEGWDANVTLIQAEAIEAVNKGYAADFTPAMLRRNIVTSNVEIDTLVGREFRCGTAILLGTKPFPPCAHLAFLLGRHEVLKYFAYCGGIGATVVKDGIIKPGDRISYVAGSNA